VSALVRVLIADDHAQTRADIRATLEADPRFTVCAEVADAAGAVSEAMSEQPDMCLLDVHMPGGGARAAWEITARLPDTKIVMLTVSRDSGDLFAALRAGACGYLLKDIPSERLPHALVDALSGKAPIPRTLVSRIIAEFRDPSPRRRGLILSDAAGKLTSREWEVLELLRQGLSTAEIAERLFVSEPTVRSHVSRVLRKLRVPDRESALRIFAGGQGPG
jgi:DNA-binding NarL/FixJ family response regulator